MATCILLFSIRAHTEFKVTIRKHELLYTSNEMMCIMAHWGIILKHPYLTQINPPFFSTTRLNHPDRSILTKSMLLRGVTPQRCGLTNLLHCCCNKESVFLANQSLPHSLIPSNQSTQPSHLPLSWNLPLSASSVFSLIIWLNCLFVFTSLFSLFSVSKLVLPWLVKSERRLHPAIVIFYWHGRFGIGCWRLFILRLTKQCGVCRLRKITGLKGEVWHFGLKWDLAGGRNLRSGVMLQQGKKTHLKITPKLIYTVSCGGLVFFVDSSPSF